MIYSELKQIAQRYPEKTALVAGQHALCYRELDQVIVRLAGHLWQCGVRPGAAVVILVPNGVEFVAAVWATLALGAIAVPLNTRFPSDEIKYYLESSEAYAVVHDPGLANMLSVIAPGKVRFTWQDFLAAGPSETEATLPAPEAETHAIHMYSSGSTGKPKRVTRTHGQLCAERRALAETIHLTGQDRILCTVPLYHAHGFSNCMLAALCNGGTLIVLPGEFNPRAAVRTIEQERITIYPAVPFMFKMIGDTRFEERSDFGSLRLAFSAGAALPQDVFDRASEALRTPVRQLYGSTETGAIAINWDGGAGSETSVGRPLKGMEVDIVDDEGTATAPGAVGLVAVRSPAMTRQYDGLPKISAECFRNGYFLPGDLGTKDADGRIYIKGRKKLLINVAGNKVDPLDVESVIGAHPKVKDVVVLGHEESVAGEMVKAVVVAYGDCTPDEIIEHCASRLAAYKVPKLVEFRAEIPRSPLGKILRKYM